MHRLSHIRTLACPGICRIVLSFIVLVLILSLPTSAERQLGERNLEFGSWGADVFWLQHSLNKFGYDIVTDGHFGSETRRAVTAFQLSNGLVPDGVAGSETIQLLTTERTWITYAVQHGDTLEKIAELFGLSVEDIKANNQLSDTTLQVRQELRLPLPKAYYIVQPGDTLSHIAVRHRTTVEALAKLNNLCNPSLIQIGMTLWLP